MEQAKFSLEAENLEFLKNYQHYGYRDKSSLVRDSLMRMKMLLEEQELQKSAVLYAEIYAEDEDLRSLTDAAIADWPV